MYVVRPASRTLERLCNNPATKNITVLFHRMSTTNSPFPKISLIERKKRKREEIFQNVLKGGIFWDIENIPVKKSVAAKRVPEIKQAITYFVTEINHYNEDCPPTKVIKTFLAVARKQGENQMPTTADFVKRHLLENQIELLDLPYSSNPDYCDDAIYRSVLCFTEEHSKSMVVALTGDVGLIRRINNIDRDFDLIVVMQRAGKRTAVMQKHCDKVKETNERGRQQAVYFMDEVIRKCVKGDVPLTFSQLLRLQYSRSQEPAALDDDHFGLLFSTSGESLSHESSNSSRRRSRYANSDGESSSSRSSSQTSVSSVEEYY